MRPHQPPLLAIPPKPLTPSQRELLRRYGTLEAQGVRQMRLGRARKAHERRKAQESRIAPLDLRGLLGRL